MRYILELQGYPKEHIEHIDLSFSQVFIFKDFIFFIFKASFLNRFLLDSAYLICQFQTLCLISLKLILC